MLEREVKWSALQIVLRLKIITRHFGRRIQIIAINMIASKAPGGSHCDLIWDHISKICWKGYKSLIIYFCSQFWLCNHVSYNQLDQTWQMAPWQKEGVSGSIIAGFHFNSWLRVLAAIKKEWGIFWCFQEREIQLAVIWRNFSAHRKMFNILPFWPFFGL